MALTSAQRLVYKQAIAVMNLPFISLAERDLNTHRGVSVVRTVSISAASLVVISLLIDPRPSLPAFHHGERLTIELLKRVLPSNQFEFYICGPPPMMNALVDGLKAWNVPGDKISFEAFGAATVRKPALQSPGSTNHTGAQNSIQPFRQSVCLAGRCGIALGAGGEKRCGH